MPRDTSTGLRNLDTGNFTAVSVQFREGELAAIDAAARRYGVGRDEMMRYAARYFTRQHDAGAVTVQTEVRQTTTGLRMP